MWILYMCELTRGATPRWCTKSKDLEDTRQVVYITLAELQPGHKPAEEGSDSYVTQETPVALSVHLSHRPGQAPLEKKEMLLSFSCTSLHSRSFHLPSPSSFLNFLCDYRCTISPLSPPITRLFLSPLPITLLLFYIHPYDFILLIPWTVSPFPSSKFAFFLWSLNPLLILFALLSTPWSDLLSLPSPSVLLSTPFLSPCRITLDIYSTAISQRRDENRFSFQQLLLSG